MRKFSTVLIFLVSTIKVQAQIPVGNYFDINGNRIDGYLDVLKYSPDDFLNITYYSNDYEKGYYYDSLGIKNEGLIKYENKKIWFKTEEQEKHKLKPNEISSIVIGVDSFFVASNFRMEQKIGPSIRMEPEFFQHVTTVGDLVFAKHYNFSSGLAVSYAVASSIIETYQVRSRDGKNWESFPHRKKAFKEVALRYFGHIPSLKSKIESAELGFEDMMTIIKMAEYDEIYKSDKKILFDKYWQEIQNEKYAQYTATITNRIDSIWTLEYFENDIKLQSVQYSSFYPNRKNGEFISFYKNGEVREITVYKNDKQLNTTLYLTSGEVYYQSFHQEYQAYGNPFRKSYYKIVNKSVDLAKDLNPFDLGEVNGDSSLMRNIIFSYLNGELVEAYRLINGEKIYQITDLNYDFKLGPIQKSMNYYMQDKDFSIAIEQNTQGKLQDKEFNNAVEKNAQGIVMLAFVIDEKGYPIEYKVLNDLHPEIDFEIETFFTKYNKKFKSMKIDRVKVKYEFVLPVIFSIVRFYKKPSNYYYNDMFFHQQQMMMHQQSIQNITPPSFY